MNFKSFASRDNTGAPSGRSERTFNDLNLPIHIAFGLTLGAFGALFATSFGTLIATWLRSGMFQFQLLIPPICAVLVWARREWLSPLTASPRPRGFILALGLGLVWLVGRFAGVNLLIDFMLIAMIPVLTYTFYGPRITRRLTFPLAYLFFAIPVGQFMVGPLQQVTAHASVALLKLTGVPVFMSGNFITTPASLWHVAEACSGVKFFLATTAFGVLYANLFFTHYRRRLIFVACSLAVPIIANTLRVYFTIMIGEGFGVQYASGTDHLIFGWQFFGTVLVLLFLAGWPWHEAPATPGAESRTSGIAGGDLSMTRVLLLGLTGIVILAIAPAWFAASRAITANSSDNGVMLPARIGTLKRLPEADPPGIGSSFSSPDTRLQATYGLGRQSLNVEYVSYAGDTREGHELVTFGNRIFDSNKWQIVSARTRTGSGGIPAFRALSLKRRHGKTHWRVRYVYRVGTHWTTSQLMVKAWATYYGIFFQAVPASLIIISAPSGVLQNPNTALDAAGKAIVRSIRRGPRESAS